MGTFIGKIKIRNYSFVNIIPLCEVVHNDIHFLTTFDRKEILPESEKGDINLYFNDIRKKPYDYFADGSYQVIDFELDDLEDNINQYGERNQTGYKAELDTLFAENRIRDLDSLNYYYKLTESQLINNYQTSPIVKVNDSNVFRGLKVVICLTGDKFKQTVLGPFTIEMNDTDRSYYINTGLQKQKYIIWGYEYKETVINHTITLGRFDDEQQQFIEINESVCKKVPIDFLPTQQIISEFKRTISSEHFIDGKLDLSNVQEVIDDYEGSAFMGPEIPEEVREQRYDKLKDLMLDEDKLDKTFQFVAECIPDLLEKYPNEYAILMDKLASDQSFLEKIPRYQKLSVIIRDKEAERDSLLQNVKSLDEEVKALEEKKVDIPKQHEYAESLLDGYEDEIQQKKDEISRLDDELKETSKTLKTVIDLANAQQELEKVQKQYEVLRNSYIYQEKDFENLKDRIDTFFRNRTENAMHIAYDGLLANRMLQNAADWENNQKKDDYDSRLSAVKSLSISQKKGEELKEYLIERIRTIRPNYKYNTVTNILICYAQSFLTVFSGEPGTGKTSICKILGSTFGLRDIKASLGMTGQDTFNPNRFINIPVERGWTSKRDFVGYFNPLTKTFDKNNRQLFDCLNILDREAKGNSTDLPFIILLDEANLSPMEYYWADFMSVCDDVTGKDNRINLGNDYSYAIPENLRFVATINNDHTTESLSPRLVDRAWVIKLPKVAPSMKTDSDYFNESFERISWSEFQKVFAAPITDEDDLLKAGEVKDIYDSIKKRFSEINVSVSQRTDNAIRKYWATAQKLFISEDGYDPAIDALDYAVSQKILPHIDGSGEEYSKALSAIASYCQEKNMRMSAEILNDIISKGNDTMFYYQFFA